MIFNYDKKYAHLFDTSKISSEVKKKSVKAGFANLLSQGMSLGITLVRAAILARLLSPEDYGVFAMVVVVASFAVIFKDLGLATATIREKKINHAQVSNLFWINTLLGFISMLIVMALAPAIVWFYHDARLADIALILSVGFLFGGMTVQHQALLKRQMQFGKIAIITVMASFASSFLGIVVAWVQGNYWALVWMQIANNLFLMIGFWFAAGWIPGFPSKNAGIRKFLKIGFDVAGLNAFSTITQQIDKIIIGRISSARVLGLYNKGAQVPKLISEQFRMAFFSVALPALSTLQSERTRFAGYYYKFLNFVCWATMPLSAFCFIFAKDIVLVYFGHKWSGAVIFMRIFSIQAFIMPAVTTLDQIPLALGFSRRYLFAGIVRSITLISCIIVIAPFYGVIGIAWCVATSDLIAFIPFIKLCLKDSPVSMKGYFSTISVPALVSICMAILFYLFNASITPGVTATIASMVSFFIFTVIFFVIADYLNIRGSTGIAQVMITRLKLRSHS